MSWHDTRVKNPSPNHFNRYQVVAYFPGSKLAMTGLGSWMPENNYTTGRWTEFEHYNGNKQTDFVVLYWRLWEPGPELREPA